MLKIIWYSQMHSVGNPESQIIKANSLYSYHRNLKSESTFFQETKT